MSGRWSAARRHALAACVGVAASCLCAPAAAALVETVIEVPVNFRARDGQQIDQTIMVTVFHDDARASAPYLILHHGRPADRDRMAAMGRQRYAANARYFVSLGFAVLVPTRVGYGVSGGSDVEYSGPCHARDFAPAFAAAAEQTIAVLTAAAALPHVDLSRGIVVGQSFGGATSIALSTRLLPGLVGAVNFSGGSGGNPSARPENPCSADRLTSVFRTYGRETQVPTLWLYSANDRFWGARLPREWFGAFVDAGGQGSFVLLPANGKDGHGIFSGDPDAWKPAFEAFIRQLGF